MTCATLERARREAKAQGLDPRQVVCALGAMGSLCDGTSCPTIDFSEPMDPETVTALGQQQVAKFYTRLAQTVALRS